MVSVGSDRENSSFFVNCRRAISGDQCYDPGETRHTSGTYICKMATKGFHQARPIVLLRWANVIVIYRRGNSTLESPRSDCNADSDFDSQGARDSDSQAGARAPWKPMCSEPLVSSTKRLVIGNLLSFSLAEHWLIRCFQSPCEGLEAATSVSTLTIVFPPRHHRGRFVIKIRFSTCSNPPLPNNVLKAPDKQQSIRVSPTPNPKIRPYQVIPPE